MPQWQQQQQQIWQQQQQQQEQQQGHVMPAKQRRVGRHEAAELAAMAAAEAAAAAQSDHSPFSSMPNGHAAAGASADSVILTCPIEGGPHQPTTAAAAAAGVHWAENDRRAVPSAPSAAVGTARTGGPVSLLVGMWKILTSYLQVSKFGLRQVYSASFEELVLRLGARVLLLVGMWKILTCYLQVTNDTSWIRP
jgi:hypothetical protein